MLTCRELEGFISDYLDGTLPRRQRRKFELHLALCRECRRYLEGYKRTIALTREAFRDPDASVPEGVPAELVEAILELLNANGAASDGDGGEGPDKESGAYVSAKSAESPGRHREKNGREVKH